MSFIFIMALDNIKILREIYLYRVLKISEKKVGTSPSQMRCRSDALCVIGYNLASSDIC